jgi:hypothetical protein
MAISLLFARFAKYLVEEFVCRPAVGVPIVIGIEVVHTVFSQGIFR